VAAARLMMLRLKHVRAILVRGNDSSVIKVSTKVDKDDIGRCCAIPSSDNAPKTSAWQETGSAIISGSLHSLIETPIVTPVEGAITQQQINGRSFLWNIVNLSEQKALYRALPAGLIAAVPKAIVHYSFLTAWSNALAPEGNLAKATPLKAWAIGSAVGATEVWLTNPLNLVKFRMQRPEWGYKGVIDAVRTIHATEGLGAFWKGAMPVAVRNSIMNGAMVGAYTHANKALEDAFPRVPADIRRFLAGSSGGVVGSLMSYPFEMMRAASMHNISFKEHILSKGPKRLLHGYAPGAARLVMTSAVMGLIIPRMKFFSTALDRRRKNEIQKLSRG